MNWHNSFTRKKNMHIIFIQPKVLKILTVKLHTTGIKHCQYICTKYSYKFQQNRLIFLLGANRPGAKRLGGRNDQGRNDLGRNAAGAKRLGGEVDLGRNDPDSSTVQTFSHSRLYRVLLVSRIPAEWYPVSSVRRSVIDGGKRWK